MADLQAHPNVRCGKCTIITITKSSEVPRKPIDGKPTLVYWDIVGIVHPLRMALTLADVEWCDVRIVPDHTKDAAANKKVWFDAKKSLQKDRILDFPNLPYFFDKNVRLVQTDAILRYLANKYNQMGSSVPQHTTDMLLEEARDLDDTIVRLSYEEGGDAVAKWLSSPDLRNKMDTWGGYIKRNDYKFVTGEDLTVVDLRLFTFVFKFQHAQAAVMVQDGETPGLPFWVLAYLDRVKNASSQLKEYLDCPDMNLPINHYHARFCNF